jgi:acyl-CoA synthetase
MRACGRTPTHCAIAGGASRGRSSAQWVDALAAELHAAGLKRGQRVSVWLPNRVEAAVVLLACSRNGYVCNPSLHQNYTVADIVQLLDRIQTAVLFAQPGYGADADRVDVFAAAAALPAMKRDLSIGVARCRIRGIRHACEVSGVGKRSGCIARARS